MLNKKIGKLFQKVLRRSGLFKHVNVTGRLNIGNTRFRIPIIRQMGLGNITITEPWMGELLIDLLSKRDGAFIDIGANIGQTLLKLKSVAPEVEYIGFEPNPACIYYLRELINTNQFTRTEILPIGLSNTDTVVELLYMGLSEVNSAASIVQDYRPNNKIYDRQYVPIFTFDHILEVLKPAQIAIIKIDVEGAEMEVLQGMHHTLSEQHPFIIMEILPAYTAQNTMRLERQKRIEVFVYEHRYEIYRIEKTSDERLAGLTKLKAIEIHGDLKLCDYLLKPIFQSVGSYLVL
jgi:FkbM family methyltransferase